ncbi:hypothetical protein [Serratia sp. Se-RSBMAAmG]|uniref:hypothetical protein n=1 Tax=Serratia sp. Se-RSBMAAmG TaxID=3043305 RepID=UPI0024AF94B5|nr:hypothetical protein [Serratia sp. Se-RSBMAAmG]MDI6976254.1 hypothetical protein [Serratia sp. Se-RSBMAAmG]
MTFYDLYDKYITDFAFQHCEEVRSVAVFHGNPQSEDDLKNAYCYYPKKGMNGKSNETQNIPVFKAFIEGFYEEFFEQYKELIKSELLGHFPKMDDKSASQLNKLKLNYRPCRLSKDRIIYELYLKLIIELIDQVLFEGTRRKKYSMLINKFEPNYLEVMDMTDCDYCGKHIAIIYDFDRKVFRHSDHFTHEAGKCESLAKKSKPVYSFQLKVPSKKLVFINDIRQVFEVEREDHLEVSIGTKLGRKKECEEYVKHGMAYFTMLNNSPHIYQHKTKNEIIIDPENVKLKWDEDTDNIKKANDYYDRGFICTDLWAVCMSDHDDFMKRCAEKNIDPSKLRLVIVDIPSDTIKVKYNFDTFLIQISY